MTPHKGWFSIVQFCSDASRLESANIGVLLFCAALKFLEVRIAPDNRRIIRFFGSDAIDLDSINVFKKGLKDRLLKERENIQSREQLLEFVNSRANEIRLSAPRSVRVTSPHEQLDDLFAKLVV